jgi:hypothetical protein
MQLPRFVVWAQSARDALDEVIEYIREILHGHALIWQRAAL